MPERTPATTGLAFVMALVAWGTYFYGNSFYLHALVKVGRFDVADVSTAIAVGFWCAIPGSLAVGWVFDRFGNRWGALGVVSAGALMLGGGVMSLGFATSTWQLYTAYVLMGLAYPTLSTPAVSALLLQRIPPANYQWALSLALTGASVGGAAAAPLLVLGDGNWGLEKTLTATGLIVVGAVIPAAVVILRPTMSTWVASNNSGDAAAVVSLRAAIGSGPFLTIFLVALLSLAAQVGFLAHQLSVLVTTMSPGLASGVITATAFSAAVGRFTFAALLSRSSLRVLAWGTYLTMALGIAVVALGSSASLMTVGSIVMGFSVGAVVMLPPLMCRASFPSHYYGRIYGLIAVAVYAGGGLGPGLIGLLREATGAASALWALVVLSIAAAVAVSGLGGSDDKRRTRAG